MMHNLGGTNFQEVEYPLSTQLQTVPIWYTTCMFEMLSSSLVVSLSLTFDISLTLEEGEDVNIQTDR